jgi:hypothetical protein
LKKKCGRKERKNKLTTRSRIQHFKTIGNHLSSGTKPKKTNACTSTELAKKNFFQHELHPTAKEAMANKI